jgi:3-oxoacyl-[acyl-carrier protein] reductase
MELELDGKVCVVTGASRGIGLATGRRLCEEGARVLFVARSEEALVAAAEECGAEYLACDVTQPDAPRRIVATCAEQMGGIDVLVNNAGTSFARPLDDLADEEWQGQLDLHVMAPLRLMREAAPRMAERGAGRIVNVTSSSGRRVSSTNAAYSVSKAAQQALSRAFADRWAPDGVLVNAVAPGPVGTELWLGEGGLADQAAAGGGSSRDEVLEAQAAKVPLGRMGRPEEIADVVVFLCSARVSNVTGATLAADGGVVPSFL